HGHHHHHLWPSLLPAIPSRPRCCCCCCVRRILLHHQHHHFHHQLFHAQAPLPWTPYGFPPLLVPGPGVSPPPTLPYRGDQCGATAQDAVEAGGTLITSEDISSNRLQEGTWEENFEGEEGVGEAGEEEEEEAVYLEGQDYSEQRGKRQVERGNNIDYMVKRSKQQEAGNGV
ncbi:hypothetical protein Taro_028434, partial [Colocasia esculenta]|nr:hypothetical protein [Colocasia esculenta]